MTYPLIPIGLIIIFIIYVIYLAFVKKDMQMLRSVLYPGLFFITVWALIYYFMLR
ncbi:hypothetical protein [Chryseobacterium sp.]|uniref:hypothetical protein n=1 Tax=Chryseobacterium sp. TaxID=1871047 RepID=UPI0016570934|nr:hypothetical protein [Chryseobacterium sp.]